MSTKKRFAILIPAALFLLIVVSYWFHLWLPKEKRTTHLILGTSASISAGLLSIAENQGYFREEEIRAEIRRYSSAGVAFKEMLDRKIDMAGVSETPLVYKAFSRENFRIVAVGSTTSSDPKIVVRRSSNVFFPKDLSGKRIGTTRAGQSAHFFLSLFLLKHTIPEEEVTILHDSPAAIVDRLVSGDLDAASLFEPFAFEAAKRLGEGGLLFEEAGLYHKTFCLTARPEWIERNREPLKSFLRALIRAESFCQNHPDAAMKIIAEDISADPEVVQNFIRKASFGVNLHGSLIETLRDQARWALRQKLVRDEKIPLFHRLIDPTLLREIDPGRVGIGL